MSLSFVEQYAENGKAVANQARNKVISGLESLPSYVLADYFSNYDILQSLFNTAVAFENLSMAKTFALHDTSTVEIKGFVGVLLDFYSIDRVAFAEAARAHNS